MQGEATHAVERRRRVALARCRSANYFPSRCCSPPGLAACSPSSERPRETAAAAGPAGKFDFEGWDQYLGGADSSQFSSLAQIDKSNVGQLEVAWTYPTDENYLFNPLVVGGMMYVLAKGRSIVALDAATGRELWTHANEGAVGTRGMNYWRSPDGSEERLLYINAGHLTAIDAKTGETITNVRRRWPRRLARRARRRHQRRSARCKPTTRAGSSRTSSSCRCRPAAPATPPRRPTFTPTTCARASLQWIFHTVPRPGEFGADTWPEKGLGNYGGVHNWSESTVDAELGIIYVPTGTARYDFYGGNRHGENLFGNSLLALDARSGKRLLALPDDPPRSVGLRPADRAEAAERRARRPDRSRPSRNRASKASSTSSIASPAHRSGRSKSAPCRNPTRPAR